MCGVKRLAWLVPWHREEIPNLNLMIPADFLWLLLEQKKRAGVPPATPGLHICLLFYLCEVIKSWHFISVHSTVLWPLLIDCPPSSNTPSLRLSNQPFSQIPLWPLFHFSNILNPPFFPCFFSLFSSLQSSMSQSQSSQQPTSNALDFILPRLCGVTETPWIIWSLSWLVSRCFQARGAIFEPHSQADTHCFSPDLSESRSRHAGEHVQTQPLPAVTFPHLAGAHPVRLRFLHLLLVWGNTQGGEASLPVARQVEELWAEQQSAVHHRWEQETMSDIVSVWLNLTYRCRCWCSSLHFQVKFSRKVKEIFHT